MSGEKDKKKVLIVSLFIFLITGGGIFVFLIFNSLEDLKNQPGFEFEYNTFAKKALLPILKYAGIVDEEVISVKKNIDSSVYDSNEKIVLKKDSDKSLDSAETSSKTTPSKKDYSSSSSSGNYYPPNKLSSQISGGSFASAGGSQTSGSLSRFSSGNTSKEVSISQSSSSNSKANSNSKNLMARLEAMKGTMMEAYKSGSAIEAKYKWDKSFVGSLGGGHSMMYSGGGIMKLDKLDAGIKDLKIGETKGLTAPEPGKPIEDKEAEAKDPVKQKAEEAAKEMLKSVLDGLSNSVVGAGLSKKSDYDANSNLNGESPSSEVLNKIKRMVLESDSEVTVSYNPLTGNYLVTFNGQDETGRYSDFALLDRNGKIINVTYNNLP